MPPLLLLAISVTSALVLERILFAFISLLFYLFHQGQDGKSSMLVGSVLQSASAMVANVVNSILGLLSVSFRTLILCALILLIWGILYTCAHHSAYAMIAFQNAYNGNVGGTFRMAFVIPARVAQILWSGVVPVYNLAVYCVKTIPTKVLLENILLNLDDFQNAMINLGQFIVTLTTSLFNYVQLIIHPPDSFDPNLRLLDLVTPLSYWRLFVSYLLSWTGKVCAVASSTIDILAYPFLDINFGLGVHRLINAILSLVIQVPSATIQRCAAGGGPVVYCLPDFEPVIELLVEGIRNMGLLVDNWLDVTTLIIQAVLTGTSPKCDGWTTVQNFSSSLMGKNATIIVGVDDGHFAETDGWNAVLFSRTGSQSFPDAFPFQVNTNYGIAVVSAGGGVKGLMGCACSDMSWGLQLVCAVVPLDALASSFYIPVEFDVPSTSFYMGCNRAKIRLESIRWPVTRHTTPTPNAKSSMSAEAALYVMPMCSSEQIDIVCIETFKLANCYPYCMALWTTSYTGSLILRGGDEWSRTVSMVQRDCGLHTWDLKSGEIASMTATLRQNSGVKSPWSNVEVQLNGSHCQYSPGTLSRLVRDTVPTYSVYRSVERPGQPFAFAGDLILTAVNTVGDTWGVDVQRIWGDQGNEFTVVHVNKFIPALPPCKTPSDCTATANSCGTAAGCRVSVPYAFDSTPWTHVPAVATDRYAFWITNPSMAMYWAFNQWCNGKLGALAFQAESSYSSIQIWRMDPYEFCPIDPITNTRRCPEDTSATFITLPGFVSGNQGAEVCNQFFYVVAPTITYVNEFNLAITVLNTTFVNVNATSLQPLDPAKARYYGLRPPLSSSTYST